MLIVRALKLHFKTQYRAQMLKQNFPQTVPKGSQRNLNLQRYINLQRAGVF